MLEDYRKARKLAYARVQKDVAAGQYPYPPALDDILKGEGYQAEVPIGLSEIDISLIAGTKTRGRQNSFSSNFMPLPESSSEFAMKWSDLIDSQRAEGIREPIVVFEFMQRFYVQEGNKRVSVLRYLKTTDNTCDDYTCFADAFGQPGVSCVPRVHEVLSGCSHLRYRIFQ